MYVCMYVELNVGLKRLSRFKILPIIGSASFYMFLWHTPINLLLYSMSLEWNNWSLFVISFSMSIIMSIVQYWINIKWINPLLMKIQ